MSERVHREQRLRQQREQRALLEEHVARLPELGTSARMVGNSEDA
jgi:hypothetical protein